MKEPYKGRKYIEMSPKSQIKAFGRHFLYLEM